MTFASVEAIAQAVLYEGYILYPYRPALKNRQRWTFGGVFPRAYCEGRRASDTCLMQTECLALGDCRTRLEAKVRFLHLTMRAVSERVSSPAGELDDPPEFRPVGSLRVEDREFATWQEAVEREMAVEAQQFGDLLEEPKRWRFAFAEHCEQEPIRSANGEVVGLLVRERQPLDVEVELSARAVGKGVFQVRVAVTNETPCESASLASRDEALMRSLASTHVALRLSGGEFVSLTDPPTAHREAAAACQNIGVWPVLIGEPGRTDRMLAAPIILYDYPQVAPESPGDFFDGTEIDEMLSLRIMTLTEEEKGQMAAVDPRTRELLERTEALAREQFLGLHGAVRSAMPRKSRSST